MGYNFNFIKGTIESRMVPCLIIIISYVKHQNNNLTKFSRDTTLSFYQNNNYVSSADFSCSFLLLFCSQNQHHIIIIMSHPQPHIYNFTAAPKNQHNYLVPIQYVATLLFRRLKNVCMIQIHNTYNLWLLRERELNIFWSRNHVTYYWLVKSEENIY